METIRRDSPSHEFGWLSMTRRRRCAPCLVFTHDSSTSGAAGRGKPVWCSMNKTNDSDTSVVACQVKAMQECSPVCGMDVSRPSLSKARYKDRLDYHRVRSLRDLNTAFTTNRSLRDLAPMCLRHIGAPRLKSGGEMHHDATISRCKSGR